MYELILYYRAKCSFSQKVCDYMEQNNIQIHKRDIDKNFMYRLKLQEDAGKMQIPCLLVNGEALFGYDNIIKWFEEHLVKG